MQAFEDYTAAVAAQKAAKDSHATADVSLKQSAETLKAAIDAEVTAVTQ